MKIPPPPVPAQLREMLKDYPELIQEIQDRLNELVDELLGGTATPPFERAVWLLEDTLSAFISDARRELEAAKTSGDPQAIERAKAKVELMFDAQAFGWKDSDELFDYFEIHARAFK